MFDGRFRVTFIFTLSAAYLFLAAPGALADSYTVEEIGRPFYYGSAINEGGAIAGSATAPSGVGYSQAAIFNGTSTMYLPINQIYLQYSEATGINSSGHASGYISFETTIGNSIYDAIYYDGSSVHDLGGILNSIYSFAEGINESGDVVGFANDANGNQQAFVYNGTSVQHFSLGGTYSAAYAINDSGQVTGYAAPASGGQAHAFLYDGNSTRDLGALSGGFSQGNAINQLGEVAGDASLSNGNVHAFIYDNGSMIDLSTLGGSNSSARGINDAGMVVGSSVDASGNEDAFVDINGAMTDLNTTFQHDSSFHLSTANAINDSGQIVAFGADARGQYATFILTPDASGALAAPLPPAAIGGFALLVAIGTWRMFCARRATRTREIVQ